MTSSHCLRTLDGHVLPVPAHRWFEPVTGAEYRLLERARGPVLDIGCGPARHALALAEGGTVSLGIDISLPALAVARRRGAPVLQRSIFDRVPGHGRWGTALLLDGNIGIGGEPATLLRRVHALLRVDGRILIEVAGSGAPTSRHTVRLEHDGQASPWFAWSGVDVDDLDALARDSRLHVRGVWTDADRYFAQLDK
ncbi:MAG TPA: class I SAM-dependent methyltransferase [Acidimicrobiia bacterium]|nr:class I SAM-dependent methyltransferase [Acidimicrobiia bacterium]